MPFVGKDGQLDERYRTVAGYQPCIDGNQDTLYDNAAFLLDGFKRLSAMPEATTRALCIRVRQHARHASKQQRHGASGVVFQVWKVINNRKKGRGGRT
jgi:hypothetical protein